MNESTGASLPADRPGAAPGAVEPPDGPVVLFERRRVHRARRPAARGAPAAVVELVRAGVGPVVGDGPVVASRLAGARRGEPPAVRRGRLDLLGPRLAMRDADETVAAVAAAVVLGRSGRDRQERESGGERDRKSVVEGKRVE